MNSQTGMHHKRGVMVIVILVVVISAGAYLSSKGLLSRSVVGTTASSLESQISELTPERQARLVLFTATAYFLRWVEAMEKDISYGAFSTDPKGEVILRQEMEKNGLANVELRFFFSGKDFVVRARHQNLPWSLCIDHESIIQIRGFGEDEFLTNLRDAEYSQYPSTDIGKNEMCDGRPLKTI